MNVCVFHIFLCNSLIEPVILHGAPGSEPAIDVLITNTAGKFCIYCTIFGGSYMVKRFKITQYF